MPENERSMLEPELTEQAAEPEAAGSGASGKAPDPESNGNIGQAEITGEKMDEAAEKAARDEKNRLFTMHFRIPLEDYYQFHLIMGRDALVKGKKKTQLLGLVEFVFGLFFLFSLFTTDTQASGFYYFVIAVLIIMGAYGMTYHKFFYEKSLRRAVAKQYEKVPYLHNEIVIDFYPNKMIERSQDQQVETFWHTIQEVRVSNSLYMVMLGERRCLLVPKAGILDQKEEFEDLLKQVCENFEKPRYEV